MTKTSAKIHKWLALILTVPIFFWFVSGLFFAVAPIEKFRSEHMTEEAQPVAIVLAAAGAGLSRIAAMHFDFGEKIELRTKLGRPVALISSGETKPPLYDLTTGDRLSPIPASLAAEIAKRTMRVLSAPRVERVTEKAHEYKGVLPAWRVDFDDGGNRSL